MDASNLQQDRELAQKIARLVEERGWNQEDFARIAQLNRHTVRQIMRGEQNRKLRNATVQQCAAALGLQVSELRNTNLDRLLSKLHHPNGVTHAPAEPCNLIHQATHPDLVAWIERNPERCAQLQPEEVAELLKLQGSDGPFRMIGVEHFIELIERKRRLLNQVRAIAGTEYMDLLEQLVRLMYEKINPPRGMG